MSTPVGPFAERLDQALQRSKLSVRSCARRAAVDRPHIHRYLRGDVLQPGPAVAQRLAAATGVDYAWLLLGVGEP